MFKQKGQLDHRWTYQQDYGSIPPAAKATRTALSPDRAHNRRVGAPTERMTALPSKKQADKKHNRR